MVPSKFAWLLGLFASVFITMMIMWIIKKTAVKYNIPIVSDMAKET